METLKDIKGYEGLYQISNKGRVWSKRSNKWIKYRVNNKGYFYFDLWKNSIRHRFLAHQLVGEAFVPNPHNKTEIDHILPIKDGGTNEASNLRWVSHQENMNNDLTRQRISKGLKGKLCGEKHPMFGKQHTEESKIKMSESHKRNPTKYWLGKEKSEEIRKKISESVKKITIFKDNNPNPPKKLYQYTLDNELVKIWNSVNECRKNGYSQGCISQCCNGKRNQYKGFKWSYTKKEDVN